MRVLTQVAAGLAVGAALMAAFWSGVEPARSPEPSVAKPPASDLEAVPSDNVVVTRPEAVPTAEPAAAAKSEKRYRTLLHTPVADAAGTLRAGGYAITLDGVTPTNPDRSCRNGGGEWPCGAIARTAFRAWLRGRAVSCAVPRREKWKPLTTDCTVGGEDIGEWLVRHGWAEAAPDGLYSEAAAAAQRERAGLFGDRPR